MTKEEKLEIALDMSNLIDTYADRLTEHIIDSAYGNVLCDEFQPDIELAEMRGMYRVANLVSGGVINGDKALNAFGSMISEDDVSSESMEYIVSCVLESLGISPSDFENYKCLMED